MLKQAPVNLKEGYGVAFCQEELACLLVGKEAFFPSILKKGLVFSFKLL